MAVGFGQNLQLGVPSNVRNSLMAAGTPVAGMTQGYSSAAPAASPLKAIGSAALFATVPWLGVANLAFQGIGAYFKWQGAKRAASAREANRQESIRQFNVQAGLSQQQINDTMSRFKIARSDDLKNLRGQKMQYMIENNPRLREHVKQLRTMRYNTRAAKALPAPTV